MVEKFYDNRNFKILKINKKTENISMLIIVLCTLLLLVFFLKIALFKELVDSPQKRTEKTEEVSMIFL